MSWRWGPRSLAGRLIVVILGPLVLVVLLVASELRSQRATASAAQDLADRIDLMADVGSLRAPASFERIASLGLATIDGLVDRSVIVDAVGYDMTVYLESARTSVDAGLNRLLVDHGDLRLPDGSTMAERIHVVRRDLDQQRMLLDATIADVGYLGAAIDRLLVFIDDVTAATVGAETDGGTELDSADLTALVSSPLHVIELLSALSTEAQTTASVLATPDGSTTAAEAFRATGSAVEELEHYASFVRGDRAIRWAELARDPSVLAYAAMGDQIDQALIDRAQDPGALSNLELLARDPDYVKFLAGVQQTSFERLAAYDSYAQRVLSEDAARARDVGDRAEASAARWFALLVVLSVASAVAVAVTVRATVRPLATLAERARHIGRGELGDRPLPLVGPTDIREVTATVNTMAATIDMFDDQLGQVIAGNLPDATSIAALPGAFGASLRASINQISDVTQRLRDSEALAQAIVATAADAIWTVGSDGRIVTANHAAAQLLGLPVDMQPGQNLPALFGRSAGIRDLHGELEFRRHDGAHVHVLVSRSEVPGAPTTLHTVFAKDISERKRFEERLAHQARHDALTGLPNRLAAFERLDDAIAVAHPTVRPLSVLFIDLDGFKNINDTRGHACGDRVLQQVGMRLRTGLRDSEFVARLGGDEFLVVADGAGFDLSLQLADRLLTSLAQPFEIDDEMFVLSASIGIAVADAVGLDGLELVRRADVAVYHAKQQGRARCVVFDATLQDAVEANAEIELALHQALANGEFELHYQPIVDLTTKQPWGAEALLRWNRPGHGQLLPEKFIPVAERSPLIFEIEQWVLHRACATLAAWQALPDRHDLRIAVNVSGRHLVDGDILGDIAAALKASRADPHGLEIELTETHLLADLEHANRVLEQIRSWGIDVAVDDFGTGYSSMSYLRELSVDTIKIDRTFIALTQQAGYDRTIVEVLLQLGEALGLGVVAEGVETDEQLQFLMARGCGRGQGFHLARPMPLDDVETWLGMTDKAIPATR